MNAPHRLLTSPERMRLTVEHFLLLDEGGAFADYSKVELIDGDIYVMNAQLTRHARTKSRLFTELALGLRLIGGDLEAISEVSVRVSDDGMPEPDIVLTRFRGQREVPAETVALVVEVSDTTLAIDLGRKAALYAAAGIAEYWVVDVEALQVLMHDRPEATGYQRRRDQPIGEPLRSLTIPSLEVSTDTLLD